jgi:pimeloyl-ACP methyl ester carboxylesterase
MKVSIVWGGEDKLISMKSVEIMKKSIPTVELHLLKQCGHVPQLERPKEFVDIVRGILHGAQLDATRNGSISTPTLT